MTPFHSELEHTDVGPIGSAFLAEYFRGTDGHVYVGAIRNGDSKLERGEIAKTVGRARSNVDAFLAAHDKPEHETAIYFCTATLRAGRTQRSSDDCHEFTSLFADIDDHNHELDRARIIALLEGCECPATMIINSGHGLQPHWLLAEPCEDAERIIKARKRLHELTASDAVHDAPRYMRLPGSHNSKRGDWLPVEAVSYHPERRYELEVLEDWLDEAATIVPRKPKQKANGHAAHFEMPLPPPGTLAASAAELANAGDGTRHNTLLAKANRMGTMIARGWIDTMEVRRAFYAAAEANGQVKQYGIGHFNDTFSDGIGHGMRTPHLDLSDNDEPAAINCTKAPGELQSARASTFELSAIQWLWPNRFALGKLGLLVGLPDEGKGQIFADMAARVTCGLEWPCGEGRAPQGNVMLLTAEDDIADTVVPRLIGAGADLDCVEIVRMVRTGNKDRMFNLITDLQLLRQKIAEVGNVKMIQIDPISAYLGVGKIDSFRTTDVRAVLSPLVDLASEQMVSILGIMHFNKKTDVSNALLRISDSLAFGATARHVYAVVNDAENKRKLFVKGKNNLAPDTKALAYGFGLREVGRDRKNGETIRARHIAWHPQHVDVTAAEAMQAASESKSPAARDGAKKFLADALAAGAVAKRDIEEAAEANGIAERTLFRAKNELNVIAKKDGPNGTWTWRLPSTTQQPRWDSNL